MSFQDRPPLKRARKDLSTFPPVASLPHQQHQLPTKPAFQSFALPQEPHAQLQHQDAPFNQISTHQSDRLEHTHHYNAQQLSHAHHAHTSYAQNQHTTDAQYRHPSYSHGQHLYQTHRQHLSYAPHVYQAQPPFAQFHQPITATPSFYQPSLPSALQQSFPPYTAIRSTACVVPHRVIPHAGPLKHRSTNIETPEIRTGSSQLRPSGKGDPKDGYATTAKQPNRNIIVISSDESDSDSSMDELDKQIAAGGSRSIRGLPRQKMSGASTSRVASTSKPVQPYNFQSVLQLPALSRVAN